MLLTLQFFIRFIHHYILYIAYHLVVGRENVQLLSLIKCNPFTDICHNVKGTQCNPLSTPAKKKQYCDPTWAAGYDWMKVNCAKVCDIKCGE